MANTGNPYLAGYEQYLIRRSPEASQTEAQPAYIQPPHPAVANPPSIRTPASATVTNAPVVPMDAPESVVTQPAQQDVPASAPVYTRPQTPTTLNIVTRPSGGTLGQPAQPAVEITISADPEDSLAEQPYVSHLQGLTVQQMLDLDIDALVLKIDKHHSQAKKVVLDHFMETKARLMQTQNEALDEERQKGAGHLAAKEEELKLLKSELDAERFKSQRLWDMVNRACTVYDRAKERHRTALAQFQVFCAWRHQAAALARRRRMLARAERWDVDSRLKRNVFRAWFRETMREHRVTVNNRYIQEVENAKRLIHEHYQGQVAELEQLLEDSRLQLEREADARAKLEDNMKRAFMRGVCALNIEAMNIMKRGGGPAGATNSSAGQASGYDQQAPEPSPGRPPAPMPGPYGAQVPGAGPAPDAVNLDLRGSITLSPTHYVPSAAAATSAAEPPTGGGGGMGGGIGSFGSSIQVMGPTASVSGVQQQQQQPLSSTGTGHLRGTTMSAPPAGYSMGPASSSRPGSSSGGLGGGVVVGPGTNPLVLRGSAGIAQPGGPPSTSGGGVEGGPVVRETAQNFYQRPPVVVTRGPGLAAVGVKSGEAPRPRTGAPLPTVRMN